jgi:hypothetical protein
MIGFTIFVSLLLRDVINLQIWDIYNEHGTDLHYSRYEVENSNSYVSIESNFYFDNSSSIYEICEKLVL